MACRIVKETNGTEWWRVSKDSCRNAKGVPLRSYDEVQVKWSVNGAGDALILDQGDEEQVITISLGQVYDLIDALNRAVGIVIERNTLI